MKKGFKFFIYSSIGIGAFVALFYWSSKNWTTETKLEIEQEIGGSLLCYVDEWMDQHSWGTLVHYYSVKSNDTTLIGYGDFRQTEWYNQPQLKELEFGTVLISREFNYDKIILLCDTLWSEIIFNQNRIEKQEVWKNLNLQTQWDTQENSSIIKQVNNSVLVVQYTCKNQYNEIMDFECHFSYNPEYKDFEMTSIKHLD